MRGQGALEYLIIIAAVLGISAVVVLFVSGAFTSSTAGADIAKCRLAAANCQRDITLGLGTSCTYCETSCEDPSGNDLLDKSPYCGLACQQCQLGLSSSSSLSSLGLVAFWKFDEGSGTTAYDSSGNGNNGILTNGPVFTAGRSGNGLRFDGLNDYVIVADSPSLRPNNFTIEAWIMPPAFVGHVLGKEYGSTSDNSYVVWISAANVLSAHSSPGGFVSYPTLQLNSWYHVAYVKDGTAVRFYINGTQVTSTTMSLIVNYDASNLFIGADDNDNNEIGDGTFNGIIDEVRIYNRALQSAEIANSYNALK